MASGQPDYTRQVAVTVFSPPAAIDVNVESQAAPVEVQFPATQDVAVLSMPTSSGVQIKGQDAALTTTPSEPFIPGRTAAFEDASFMHDDPTATHDVHTALGRNGHDGYIHNAGSGDLQYLISDDGTNWGGTHTLQAGAKVKLTGLDISKIKIMPVADTTYYIAVV